MRELITISIIFVLISGCGLMDSSEQKQKFKYDWREVPRFKEWSNTAIEVTGKDVLYVAQYNELYKSTDFGKSFSRVLTPDSSDISKIRYLDNKLYIIGNTFHSGPGLTGNFISWVYVSENEGESWEEITGGYIMQDLTFYNDRIHIGRKHGVTTLDLNTGETFRNSFIYSKLSDHIEEIEATSDGKIFLASHDGLHVSLDNGESWEKASKNISKNDDFFRSVEIDEHNDLYVAESGRIYKVLGESLHWESYYSRPYNDQIKLLPNNKILILDSYILKISDREELQFENIGPQSTLEHGPYFKFIDSFSNGDIVLAGHSNLFIGKKRN